jgi:hypothetical protein
MKEPHMGAHSHRIVLESDASKAEWLLEWDNVTFELKDADGRVVYESEAAEAHRIVELYELYEEGKISLSSPYGSLVFEKNPAALADLRQFMDAAIASDVEYRKALRRQSLRLVPLGLAMFFVAGGLFGLYCWYAARAPDPPPGHWIRRLGWLIHGVLVVLLGAALAGPLLCFAGFRLWRRVRRIERAVVSEGRRTCSRV